MTSDYDDPEHDAWINLQLEQQAEDQRLYKFRERRELEALECDHEFETVDRLDKDTVLEICLICDFERVIDEPKEHLPNDS